MTYLHMCTINMKIIEEYRLTKNAFRIRSSGKNNSLFPFDTKPAAYKTTSPIILRCRWNVFTELLPGNDREIHRQTYRHMRPAILRLLRVFFAAGTCLPSRCLAKKGRMHFTEPFPNK
jgi:hypothetical protein